MKKKKKLAEKLFEYRIKYNAGSYHSVMDSYHYFMAKNSKEALDSHESMLKKKGLIVQNIYIEKFNPYSGKWSERQNL